MLDYNAVIWADLARQKFLMFQNKAVETLTGFGLTVLQAKVYLTLAKGGKATVKDIAKKSDIARQDLYRITPRLLNLGLIEKHIDKPTRFKAIPVKEAIDILIDRRKNQTFQLEHESKQLLQYFKENEGSEPKDEESQFMIINDLQACQMKARKQTIAAQKSINIVTKWKFFLTYLPVLIDEYLKLLNKGVQVHIVTQVPKKTDVFPKQLDRVLKHPNFELRYIPSPPTSIVAVFDEDEVNISLASDKTPVETGILTSNNANLIELSLNYFKMVWATGAVCCFN